MNDMHLTSLVVENFRSLRGKVVIPLDAQVVLIHGTNGMGKTSVLSALELGLTGKIAHLAVDGTGYRKYLTTLDTGGGSILLTASAPDSKSPPPIGTLDYDTNKFKPDPLLNEADARFFAERCYLPQSTLGRLLEIYDDQKTSSTSPLTHFVKELLGLDPLDALIDGLNPAFNVTRVRRIAPDYRRLEALKVSLEDEITNARRTLAEFRRTAEERCERIDAALSGLGKVPPYPPIAAILELSDFRANLAREREDSRRLVDLSRLHAELRALLERWRSLPSEDTSRDQADKERNERAATEDLAGWRAGPGGVLDAMVNAARALFPDIPDFDDGPEIARSEALRRAEGEIMRLDALIAKHESSTQRVSELDTIIQRAGTRIEELTRDLAGGSEDAKTLAAALAEVVPHIHSEACPVCDRDFSEQQTTPLTVHVSNKIAALSARAGQLQALATERAQEHELLSRAQRERIGAGNDILAPQHLSDTTLRRAHVVNLTQSLRDFSQVALDGTRLLSQAATARQALGLSRRRDQDTASLIPEISAAVLKATGQPANAFSTIEAAITEAVQRCEADQVAAQQMDSRYIQLLTDLDERLQELNRIKEIEADKDELSGQLRSIAEAIRKVDHTRQQSKLVSQAADQVRSAIVKKVFSNSLNRVWRDLFVRLAPSEQFVPAFKLPPSGGGKVEAVLETLHRSGKASGSPGEMLSQGNLNTAALTLFLALHLSVPQRFPWLVLDDPVQSMDDVHIAQFAALLRTLAKGMRRQVILAVHERALFDYLKLELSPAFPGDSLIAVEITRNFQGDAMATPTVQTYEADKVIAA